MIAFVNHWELIVILVVVLVLFGHRLPGMARSLGSGITEFKRGLKEGSGPKNPDDAGSGGSASGPPARSSETPNDRSAR